MKELKTINICGIPYRIEYCDDSFDYDNNFGRIIYAEGVIKINKNCTTELRKEVLIHEIIHGILFHTGNSCHSKDETMVQALANAIYQMFELKEIETTEE